MKKHFNRMKDALLLVVLFALPASPVSFANIARRDEHFQSRAACESVGIFGVHPYSLRHTFGTRLGEADVNVKKIQGLMGHQDIKMTLRYVHPDEESLRAAVELAAGKSPGIVPGEAAAGGRGARKALKAVG